MPGDAAKFKRDSSGFFPEAERHSSSEQSNRQTHTLFVGAVWIAVLVRIAEEQPERDEDGCQQKQADDRPKQWF